MASSNGREQIQLSLKCVENRAQGIPHVANCVLSESLLFISGCL